MGNTSNNLHHKHQRCRMAYSLNNTQPVACTIIHDQPFFYMDDDIIESEDEAMLMDEFLASPELEEEIKELREKIDGYERFSLDFEEGLETSLSSSRDKAVQNFIEQSALFGAESDDSASSDVIIGEITAILDKSNYAKALISFAAQNDVAFKTSHQVRGVCYDRDVAKILVNPALSLEARIFGFVKALRQHWQHKNGTLIHPLSFHPDHAILINRAQIADAQIAVIRTAWELKLAGVEAFWAEIMAGEMSDLGRAFGREALADFRTLNNGKASTVAFETWFLSSRPDYEDKILIQKMLSDHKGYVFDNAQASKMISIETICQLGEQPSLLNAGKNYLAAYADMILSDTVFTDVRDRSNANFLWFIKFERSFKEVEGELEQQLQSSTPDLEADQKRDVHHAFFNQETSDGSRSEHNLTRRPELKGDTDYDSNAVQINFAAHRFENGSQKTE